MVEGTCEIEQSKTLLMTICHMTADLSLSVTQTDSELVAVSASKAEVPDGLEGHSYHKAVFGPERDECELLGMRVRCG